MVQAFFATPGELLLVTSEVRQYLGQAVGRYPAAVEAVIRHGQAEGVLPAGDPRPMVLTLLSMMGAFSWGGMMGSGPPPAEAARVIAGAFLHGFSVR